MQQEIIRWVGMSPEELSNEINQLIVHDFTALVQILYRLDVSEAKLKMVLSENPKEDAGRLIAALIIERLKKREEVRKQFPAQENIPEEDRW
ncbi:MAG: hypothetical protein IM541_07035 [Chitinophagaceae bacterium]|jgi:hypothetical protein|nr:hypothetical protein [Chitinophagaceae bacterium]MCA6475585.1 hypothetical protein [Chitinophagaceae bacterium]MCA6482998.1 hypothetical protein [Chitinophagaceae bacterium]MCA6495350.1 hypothetical protein [Chitinophagaceae bacterium]MCA6515512.1 hypothetical protein [Chitinophagaceae bacterium]